MARCGICLLSIVMEKRKEGRKILVGREINDWVGTSFVPWLFLRVGLDTIHEYPAEVLIYKKS